MKITIEAEPKEIADLIVALQGQPLTVIRKPYSDEYVVLEPNNNSSTINSCTSSKHD